MLKTIKRGNYNLLLFCFDVVILVDMLGDVLMFLLKNQRQTATHGAARSSVMIHVDFQVKEHCLSVTQSV